ncbi:rhodanese-like domain-containing protein [Candidatus Roizmanbacteria bacterium CG10_big_fil_rev_8_21_14_0_10_39_6]|uniref:Rhodanese-like domain-containing protein n=1 Tax=Candidatus Roizmanbacteria bacterium CG10_big_fil_rev_8_21_14_0_10_39_6 TaxID=1974853 RepID=A0A2M8KS01_9BACT|nr:MAG: rhodanese-like domain-containing protein [Candidatus Roizmanbacteria bacterium CG10_big_fil_rev_8_21_14_0_10_39_6]
MPQVEATVVKKAIDTKEDISIIDVRTPQEFSKGNIPGSINIPVEQIEKVESIFTDKSKRIYVYCLSGSRSVYAVSSMMKLEYSNVLDMKSGLLAWRSSGYPLT